MNEEITSLDRNRQKDKTIDLLDLLIVWKQHIIVIVLVSVIGALAGLLITRFFVTPKYTAKTSIYVVSTEDLSLQDLNLGTTITKDYVSLLQSKMMLEQVVNVTGHSVSIAELKNMLAVSNESNTRIVSIEITSPDAEQAMYLANSYAQQAVTYLPDIINMGAKPPVVIDSADKPTTPSNIKYLRNAFIGFVICLILILAVYTILYFANDTFNSAEDVEEYFGFAPMAVIPKNGIKHKGSYGYEYKRKNTKKKRKSGLLAKLKKREKRNETSTNQTNG